ncbi:hypothetical protein PPROV_000900700 [Pycnococcus provasolii]|uniref:J domain-containing protein n=1 Tax=Pycnococcus provasolii TaxID=41880 RepID=A0A830HUA3_9CHLO|nr:hypothetical protein PPROV_000900700 [Pycnococcus provasolii]
MAMAPPPPPSDALYAVLNAHPGCSSSELRQAFTQAVMECHPDTSSSSSSSPSVVLKHRIRLARVLFAWRSLKSPLLKQKYDANALQDAPNAPPQPPSEAEEAEDILEAEAKQRAEGWIQEMEQYLFYYPAKIKGAFTANKTESPTQTHKQVVQLRLYQLARNELKFALKHVITGPPVDQEMIDVHGALPTAYEMERCTTYPQATPTDHSVFALVSGTRVLGAVRQTPDEGLKLEIGAAGVVAVAEKHGENLVLAERVEVGRDAVAHRWRTAAELHLDASTDAWNLHVPPPTCHARLHDSAADAAVPFVPSDSYQPAAFYLSRRRLAGTTTLRLGKTAANAYALAARGGGALPFTALAMAASGIAVARRVDVGRSFTQPLGVRDHMFDGPSWYVEVAPEPTRSRSLPSSSSHATSSHPSVTRLSLRCVPLLAAAVQLAEDRSRRREGAQPDCRLM